MCLLVLEADDLGLDGRAVPWPQHVGLDMSTLRFVLADDFMRSLVGVREMAGDEVMLVAHAVVEVREGHGRCFAAPNHSLW